MICKRGVAFQMCNISVFRILVTKFKCSSLISPLSTYSSFTKINFQINQAKLLVKSSNLLSTINISSLKQHTKTTPRNRIEQKSSNSMRSQLQFSYRKRGLFSQGNCYHILNQSKQFHHIYKQ